MSRPRIIDRRGQFHVELDGLDIMLIKTSVNADGTRFQSVLEYYDTTTHAIGAMHYAYESEARSRTLECQEGK